MSQGSPVKLHAPCGRQFLKYREADLWVARPTGSPEIRFFSYFQRYGQGASFGEPGGAAFKTFRERGGAWRRKLGRSWGKGGLGQVRRAPKNGFFALISKRESFQSKLQFSFGPAPINSHLGLAGRARSKGGRRGLLAGTKKKL